MKPLSRSSIALRRLRETCPRSFVEASSFFTSMRRSIPTFSPVWLRFVGEASLSLWSATARPCPHRGMIGRFYRSGASTATDAWRWARTTFDLRRRAVANVTASLASPMRVIAVGLLGSLLVLVLEKDAEDVHPRKYRRERPLRVTWSNTRSRTSVGARGPSGVCLALAVARSSAMRDMHEPTAAGYEEPLITLGGLVTASARHLVGKSGLAGWSPGVDLHLPGTGGRALHLLLLRHGQTPLSVISAPISSSTRFLALGQLSTLIPLSS